MYNTNNEHKLRHFVEKRDFFRRMDIVCIFNLIAYNLLLEVRYPRGLPSEFRNIQFLTVRAWIRVTMLLSHYIGYELSTCPVCGNVIPTVTDDKTKTIKPGNGPLPDRCPYCNANFYKYLP